MFQGVEKLRIQCGSGTSKPYFPQIPKESYSPLNWLFPKQIKSIPKSKVPPENTIMRKVMKGGMHVCQTKAIYLMKLFLYIPDGLVLFWQVEGEYPFRQ